MKFNEHNAGHMTKMATMPIYGKIPLRIFFPATGGMILTKLGMYLQGLQPIIVCSTYDPWLTFTYFGARSNFATEKCDTDGFFENYCSL